MSRRGSLGFAVVVALIAGGLLAASPASASVSTSSSLSASGSVRMIVLLKTGAPPAGPGAMAHSERAAAVAAAAALVQAQVAAAGGQVKSRSSLIGSLAVSIPADQVDVLRARPDVVAVVPDRVVHVAAATPAPKRRPGTSPGAPKVDPTVCPADPTRPLLEPEALSLMHAASDDPATPSAADYATGAGVRVGIIGDAVDVNNPDLRRADGSPVVVDYQDFGGAGTDAPNLATEGMGDAASIAAQGRKVYDLSAFGTVPTGCTIRVRGVAPDADIVALNTVNDGGYSDSDLVQAIDYAVTVDHVDVLYEAATDDPYPDSGQDPVTLANVAAVAAGVTITTATNDAGYRAGYGPPASSLPGSDGILTIGATTQLQLEKQVGYYPTGNVYSGNIANLSSDGVAQTGHTLDAVAPGYYGWSLCTDDPARFLDCPSYPGAADGLNKWSGTSESAPLTAGVAALVIQRYRATHGGASPSPLQVKQIITGSADDIGAPADEQGAGEVDALRAVRLAGAAAHGTARAAAGPAVLVSPTQQSVTVPQAGTGATSITVTNPSLAPLNLTVARRNPVLLTTSRQQVTIALNNITDIPFTVAAGTDRIATTLAWTTVPGTYVEIFETDPNGDIANEADGQAITSTLRNEIDHPIPGQWHLNVYAIGYNGPATAEIDSYHNRSTVEGHLQVPAGGRRVVPLQLPAVDGAGDRADAITLTDDATGAILTTVPVVARTPITLRGGNGQFAGDLNGGNGRPSYLAGSATYLLRIPGGAPAINVRVHLASAGNRVDAYLISPAGQALDQQNTIPAGSSTPSNNEIDLTAVTPQPGLWHVVIGVNGSLIGVAPDVPFTATVDLAAPPVHSSALPQTPAARLIRGRAYTATLHVTNDSDIARTYIVDPRLDQQTQLPLAGPNNVSISAADAFPVATVLVPPHTTRITSTMTAGQPLAGTIAPINYSYPYSNSDPEIYQASPAGSLQITAHAPQLVSGPWLEEPTGLGPYPATGIPAPFTVNLHATITTQQFDPAVTTSTGDPWLTSTGTNTTATPLVIAAHHHADITVDISPTAPIGRRVHGTLYVDTWNPQTQVSGEVGAITYAYTITER